MNATIPTGRAARTAWRRLDTWTRAEVLQRAANDQGHPEPTVAAVAVGRRSGRQLMERMERVNLAVLRDGGPPSHPAEGGGHGEGTVGT